jgi:serine/threonine protein kinase
LKPENILLCESDYRYEPADSSYKVPVSADVRLIDFGGATFADVHHSQIVNTRQYRGPEVILGVGWSYPSDLW